MADTGLFATVIHYSYICTIILKTTAPYICRGQFINILNFIVMVIGKIRPSATIVAQFAAGVEVEAIQREGKLYLPVVAMGDFSVKDSTPEEKPKAEKPVEEREEKPKAEKPEKEETASSKLYDKDGLMDMEQSELMRICKEEFGINPSDFEGKNTNKKLRDLILDAQKNGGKKAQEPAEDKPENGLINEVSDILEDFDAGKKSKKKVISTLCGLGDDVDTDVITELVEKFESDSDVSIDDIAEKLTAAINGEKPAKGRAAKKGKDENLVNVDDLEVGDRVSVWWDDDNKEWFDGEVTAIRKGKVMVSYDDGTKEYIDPEIHTKVKRLAE